jgi:hypothetical protein
MSNTAPLSRVLNDLRERGVTCSVGPNGALQVRPPGQLTPAERQWLRRTPARCVEYLAAINDMRDTDSMIAASGIPTIHPEIQEAVNAVIAACRADDLPRVRTACAEVRATVKRLTDANQNASGRNAA